MNPTLVVLFDGQDLPEWMLESHGAIVCSFLNHFLHQDPSMRTSRFHLLNRYPSGKLYLHLRRA